MWGRVMESQELWRRRCALNLAAQLPEDEDDRRAVLQYMQELVDKFLDCESVHRDRLVVLAAGASGLSSRTR